MSAININDILKAIGEATITFFKSDMPEQIMAYGDKIYEGFIELIRFAINHFVN